MIPTTDGTVVTDTMPGRKVAFTIGDPAWVMHSLADLYSNREGACAREYATNAFDAHVMAGQTRPIEVTLPSRLSPQFVVKDFGIGMSSSDLEVIYTSFGDSTKRTSNDFNGILGFGCKAAIAYTSAFTVVSVHNRIKSTAIVTKEDGGIFLNVVDTCSTTEAEGTTVQIPVHNPEEFATKAADIYRFWKPGTILVNGAEPEWHVGEEIATDLYLSRTPGTSYVVMGNVGYRIANPDALFANSRMSNVSFVAYVPNGAVHFTPNREDLKYDPHTKNAMAEVIKRFETEVLTKAQSEIDNATTHFEAFDKWAEWTNRLGAAAFSSLVYNGDALVSNIVVERSYAMHNIDSDYGHYSYGRYTNNAPINSLRKGLIVTDYLVDRVHHTHYAKIREYARQHNLKVGEAWATSKSEFSSPWVDPKRIVSWNDIKRIKVADNAGSTGRVPGSWDYWTEDGKVEGGSVPADKTLLWHSYTDRKHIKPIIKSFDLKNVVVVVVPGNRADKFVRDNPGAVRLTKYCKALVNFDGDSMLPDAYRAKQRINKFDSDWLTKLSGHINDIDDPDFKRLKTILDAPTPSLVEYKKQEGLASLIGYGGEFRTTTASQDAPVFKKRYPLLDSLNNYYANSFKYVDVVKYINLMFKEGI